MQIPTVYKGHTIVPFCSAGPPYKAHYELTTPEAGEPRRISLTTEFTSETAAFEAAVEAAKKVVDKGLPPLGM